MLCSQNGYHRPRAWSRRKQLKEWFFTAAFQGCLPCVRYCIHAMNMHPDIPSDRAQYTVLDWSDWGYQCGFSGAMAVSDYLRRRDFDVIPPLRCCSIKMSLDSRDCPVPPFICPRGPEQHQPVSRMKHSQFKEWFFQAAKQGCLPCVRHCIEVLNMDPDVESNNCR